MIDPNKELLKWGPIDGKPIYLTAVTDSFINLHKYLGTGWPDFFSFIKNDTATFILNYGKVRKNGQKIFYDFVMKKGELQKQFKLWSSVTKKIKQQEKKVNQGLKNLSDEQLKKLILEIHKLTAMRNGRK